MIVHYSKPKEYCIHCNNKAYDFNNQIKQKTYQPETQKISIPDYKGDIEEISGGILKYCAFFGEELTSEHSQYCSNCGTKI